MIAIGTSIGIGLSAAAFAARQPNAGGCTREASGNPDAARILYCAAPKCHNDARAAQPGGGVNLPKIDALYSVL